MFGALAVSVWGLLYLGHLAESACPLPNELPNGDYSPRKDQYDPRERVTYRCNQGFYAQTKDNMDDSTVEFECQYVNRWSAVVNGEKERAYKDPARTFAWLPTCVALQDCPRPQVDPGILRLSPDKQTYQSGEGVTFQCVNQDMIPAGENTALCLPNGKWPSVPTQCVSSSLTCPVEPASDHMTLDPDVRELSPNRNITYTCENGYEIAFEGPETPGEGQGHENDDIRSHTRSCLRYSGKLDGPQPVCKKYTCDKGLTSILYGRAVFMGSSTEAHAEDIVRYKCSPGYRLIGDNVQHCVLYQGWTGQKPFCGLKYCITPKLPNGYVFPNNNTFLAGQTANFTCLEGFTLIGPNKLKCTDNLSWDSDAIPVCHKAHDRSPCMDMGIPQNGYRTIKYQYDSTFIYYGCESNYNLIGKPRVRCRDSVGRWSGVPPICKSKYSFPDPHQEALKLLSRMNQVAMSFGPDSTATYNPAVIYLVMDLSGSQADALRSAVNFLRPVVLEVMALPSRPRVGVVAFTREPQLRLAPTNCADNVINVLESLEAVREGTNIAEAFDMVLDENEGLADETKKIVLLASDGLYTEGGNPKVRAKQLKEAGFDLLFLTLSLSTMNPEMENLAANATTDIMHLHEQTQVDENFKLTLEGEFLKCGISSQNYPTPWIVKVKSTDRQEMPGVIVGTKWVLLLKPMGAFGVAGDITVKYDQGFEMSMGVAAVHTVKNHFLLLELADRLHFGPAVRAICLPVPINDESSEGFQAYARNMLVKAGTTGWVVDLEESQFATIVDCQGRGNRFFCAEATNGKYRARKHQVARPPIVMPDAGVEIPDDCNHKPETPPILNPSVKPEPETPPILNPTINPEPETPSTSNPTINPEPETPSIVNPAINPETPSISNPDTDYVEMRESVPDESVPDSDEKGEGGDDTEEEYDEYDEYDYLYDYYYDEDPPTERHRRDTSYNHGDAFTGKVHNKMDLRYRRFVLKGFYNTNASAFRRADTGLGIYVSQLTKEQE